jgi:hypothetical protein
MISKSNIIKVLTFGAMCKGAAKNLKTEQAMLKNIPFMPMTVLKII